MISRNRIAALLRSLRIRFWRSDANLLSKIACIFLILLRIRVTISTILNTITIFVASRITSILVASARFIIFTLTLAQTLLLFILEIYAILRLINSHWRISSRVWRWAGICNWNWTRAIFFFFLFRKIFYGVFSFKLLIDLLIIVLNFFKFF